ncbi:MAG TPA: hypothetical protein VM597_38700 [Gemmataceae bacterium]|nr:hypothetical protein [Gemmataceae bacterium]
MSPRTLTVRQAAERENVSPGLVYRWCRERRLAAWVAECDPGSYTGSLVHRPVPPVAGADGGDRPGRGPHAVLEDLGIGVNGDW